MCDEWTYVLCVMHVSIMCNEWTDLSHTLPCTVPATNAVLVLKTLSHICQRLKTIVSQYYD